MYTSLEDLIFLTNALTEDYSSLLNRGFLNPLSELMFENRLAPDPVMETTRALTSVFPSYERLVLEGKTEELMRSSYSVFREVGAILSTFPQDSYDYALAVACGRQFALICKKLEIPAPDSLKKDMVRRMFTTDKSLPLCIAETPLIKLARGLITRVLGKQPEIRWYEVAPGPGAVSEGIRSSQKWDPIYLMSDDALGHLGLQVRPGTASLTDSRVITVPKDARGPRIICIEPNIRMLFQQATRHALQRMFESSPYSKNINTIDQNLNQQLALTGSINGRYSTLDLAEASDRNSYALCKTLFSDVPEWWELLKASRSPRVDFGELLSGRRMTMRKFSPMGSATNFPMETLVFWALASAAVARRRGISIEKAGHLVTVFGDDTIVPTDCYEDVVNAFEAVSLKVNVDKSFSTGLFRESCGGDFFNGVSVKPIRFRRFNNTALEREKQALELRNTAYAAGLWRTAAAYDNRYRWMFTSRLSEGNMSHRLTCVPAFCGGVTVMYSPSSSRFMVHAIQVKAEKEKSRPLDIARYIEYSTLRGSDYRCNESFPPFRDGWTGAYVNTIVNRRKTRRETTLTTRNYTLHRSLSEVDMMPEVNSLIIAAHIRSGRCS